VFARHLQQSPAKATNSGKTEIRQAPRPLGEPQRRAASEPEAAKLL